MSKPAPELLTGDLAQLPSLFGVALHSLRIIKSGVPTFVPPVCKSLIAHSTTVGVFRLCGNHLTVQKLGVLLNVANPILPSDATVHDLASFLKLWLRSLPDPLLTPIIVNTFYVPGDPNSTHEILRHLDSTTRMTVAHIFSALAAIVKEANVNQMNMGNLAICFLTSLLQNGKGVDAGFKFQDFFEQSLGLLNEAQDDFIL
jgi:hypothetical protein